MSIVRHQPGKILSSAVEHGDTVYIAGTVADEPAAGVKDQTADILRQIDKLLAKCGSHKSRILSATIWVTDIRHRDEMNKAWIEWMDPANPPARACIEAKLANPLLLVEIACVAAKGGPARAAKAPAGKAAAKPKASAKDDLEAIEGIGPKIAQLLMNAGIATYEALAAAQPAALKKLLAKAGPRFALADPGTWAEQAALLARGDMSAFNKLVTRLKGGARK